jgi:hypothetical protein
MIYGADRNHAKTATSYFIRSFVTTGTDINFGGQPPISDRQVRRADMVNHANEGELRQPHRFARETATREVEDRRVTNLIRNRRPLQTYYL